MSPTESSRFFQSPGKPLVKTQLFKAVNTSNNGKNKQRFKKKNLNM